MTLFVRDETITWKNVISAENVAQGIVTVACLHESWSCRQIELCPWLGKVPNQNKYTCDHCYPVNFAELSTGLTLSGWVYIYTIRDMNWNPSPETRCKYVHVSSDAASMRHTVSGNGYHSMPLTVNGTAVTCDIYYDRPDECKYYPVTIEQMINDECDHWSWWIVFVVTIEVINYATCYCRSHNQRTY